jgi:GntR family transcriptional regulator
LEIGEKIITNDLKVEPIFSLLERKYNVPLIEAEYKLEAVAADSEAAAALQVKQRSPSFRIERTSCSTGSRPVDYERLHHSGDLVRFVTPPGPKDSSLSCLLAAYPARRVEAAIPSS